MMIAAVGGIVKVSGISIAVPATGPIPGRMPTSVPSTQPTTANSKLAGWSAVANPPIRDWRLSTLVSHRSHAGG